MNKEHIRLVIFVTFISTIWLFCFYEIGYMYLMVLPEVNNIFNKIVGMSFLGLLMRISFAIMLLGIWIIMPLFIAKDLFNSLEKRFNNPKPEKEAKK